MSQYHGLLSHYQQHMYDRDLVDEKTLDEFEDHHPLGGNGPVLFVPKKDPYSLDPPPTPEYIFDPAKMLQKAFYKGSNTQIAIGLAEPYKKLQHSWDNLISIEEEPEPEKLPVGKPGQALTAEGWSDPQEPSPLPKGGKSYAAGMPMPDLEMSILPPTFISKFQAWSRFVGDRHVRDDLHVDEAVCEVLGETVVKEKLRVDYLEFPPV